MTSRAALAAPLLLQSPPGQLTNVYEDLIGLVKSEDDSDHNDEEEFNNLAIQARQEHNLEQHIVVDLPQGRGKGILCPSAAHASGSNRFMAPRQRISYLVDHTTLTTSDPKEYKPNTHMESYRLLLEKFLSFYIEDRYSSGQVEVFAIPLPHTKIEVAKEILHSAQENSQNVDPAEEVGTVSTGAEAAVSALIEAEESGNQEMAREVEQGESMNIDQVEEQLDGEGKDTAIAEIKDDPGETATAMREVEESREEDLVAEEAPEAKIDEETEGDAKLAIHIVANKYKLSNFWSGRWRSTYILNDLTSSDLESVVKVQVHYFEEGNVQLNSNKSEKLTILSESTEEGRAKSVVRAIESFEARYQEELFRTCSELSEGAFKSLRRQLPMTKQKVDWDKVLNYKLGSELAD